jgi:prolyl-tRNA synthetase
VKTTADEQKSVYETIENLGKALKASGIRFKSDLRENYSPGYKFNAWELRGVPLRLEIGPKDVAKNETRSVRRHDGNVEQLSLTNIGMKINEILNTIQSEMFQKAKAVRDSRLIRLETWDNFVDTLNKKCLVLSPWCEQIKCEDEVKERSARMYFFV